MANITISVQSFLNASINRSITIADTSTVSQLKTAINSAEGTPTAIMELFFGSTKLVNGNTLASYSIVNGSYIKTSNNLTESGTWTKQQRQSYKLQLAALKRQADGKSRYTLDITQLPDTYNGNVSNGDDNANVGGLVTGRPWV